MKKNNEEKKSYSIHINIFDYDLLIFLSDLNIYFGRKLII